MGELKQTKFGQILRALCPEEAQFEGIRRPLRQSVGQTGRNKWHMDKGNYVICWYCLLGSELQWSSHGGSTSCGYDGGSLFLFEH